MFTKIKNTEIYARKIRLAWVKDLLYGNLKEEEIPDFTLNLILKVACNEAGESISEDDFDLDDFMAVQKYILSKINLQKKS